MSRTEGEVTGAFVSLAGALAAGDDVVELLTMLTAQCARLLDVASAGLLLADDRGELHVLAASSERTRELELFQVQCEDGPCRDSYRDGAAISVSRTWRLRSNGGPSSLRTPSMPGSPACTPYRCGCVKPSSAPGAVRYHDR